MQRITSMKTLAALAVLGLAPALATPAAAAIQCQNGFAKLQETANSAKCQKVRIGIQRRIRAQRIAARFANQARCNTNHWSPPRKLVFRRAGKWVAHVSFTCAVIR